MGDYVSEDVGVLRLRSLPNFWVHGSCDYAVVARMLPFWNLTNEQDWNICKWQQRGMDSVGYMPGPLSSRLECNADASIRWYSGQMRG